MTPLQATIRAPRFTFRYSKLINFLLFIFIAVGSWTFIEPSPYDIMSLIIVPVWFLGGFRVHKSAMVLFGLLFVSLLCLFLGAAPHFDQEEPTAHFTHTIYIYSTAVFFALFFGEDTEKRVRICLWAYVLSCVVAAAFAVVGYFDLWGSAERFAPWGRAQGPFKDPNVFGSYLTLGYLFLLQRFVLGRVKTRFDLVVSGATTLYLLLAIFLSFSRGSWGAAALASFLMTGMAFVTSDDSRMRRRILLVFAICLAVGVISVGAILSVDEVREVFTQRAVGAQDYDAGETGRFGNQLRSLPLLVEHPEGLGVLGFRKTFTLDPHQSYIGAFANGGWAGGLNFLLFVYVTGFVGFRLCLRRSPYMEDAQVVWTILLMHFLQAFQIDIDHWRFFYLQLGVLWGLEAARQRWEAHGGSLMESQPSENKALATVGAVPIGRAGGR